MKKKNSLFSLPLARFLTMKQATRPAFTISKHSPAKAKQNITKLGSAAFSLSSAGIVPSDAGKRVGKQMRVV